MRIIGKTARDEAYFLFDLPFVFLEIQPEKFNASPVGMHKGKHAFQGGGLSRAVAADKSRNFAPPQGKTCVEVKARVMLFEMLYR